MASDSRLQLHDALDTLYDELVRAQAQTRMAMAALAEAARTLPIVASGLEPLMTLEADFAGRLALLATVRDEVDGLCDENDVAQLRQHIAFLSMPGVLPAPPVAATLLN